MKLWKKVVLCATLLGAGMTGGCAGVKQGRSERYAAVKTAERDGYAIKDFDHDGYLDIASIEGGVGLIMYWNQGNETFIREAIATDIDKLIDVDDFNHDGLLDIVAGDNTRGSVKVLLGKGSRKFKEAAYIESGNEATAAKAPKEPIVHTYTLEQTKLINQPVAVKKYEFKLIPRPKIMEFEVKYNEKTKKYEVVPKEDKKE